MTKQIINTNNQILISQRQALLYCLTIKGLNIEFCKAELVALRLDTWNLVIGAYLEIK